MKAHYFLDIEKINNVMKERGISEAQLAKEIGVTKKRLHRYLTVYIEKVPFKIFVGLCIALNMSFNESITTIIPFH